MRHAKITKRGLSVLQIGKPSFLSEFKLLTNESTAPVPITPFVSIKGQHVLLRRQQIDFAR